MIFQTTKGNIPSKGNIPLREIFYKIYFCENIFPDNGIHEKGFNVGDFPNSNNCQLQMMINITINNWIYMFGENSS